MAGKIAPIGVTHLQGHFIRKYIIELLIYETKSLPTSSCGSLCAEHFRANEQNQNFSHKSIRK